MVRIRLPPAESHANFQSRRLPELWRGPRRITKATSTLCAAGSSLRSRSRSSIALRAPAMGALASDFFRLYPECFSPYV
jgi:hypothetical protein